MCWLQYVLKRAEAKGSKTKIHSYSHALLPPTPNSVLLQFVCTPALGNEDQSCLEASELGQWETCRNL